jgi:hypothetical protein
MVYCLAVRSKKWAELLVSWSFLLFLVDNFTFELAQQAAGSTSVDACFTFYTLFSPPFVYCLTRVTAHARSFASITRKCTKPSTITVSLHRNKHLCSTANG